MSGSIPLNLQFALMLFNGVGTLLVGIAVVDLLTPLDLVPDGWRFPFYQWTMIIVGVCMCITAGIIRLRALIQINADNHSND
ncbi:hypothetical protein C4K68_03535 [Pokkaliibacter plantistimulans]|uniref:Uncharacterized protein n=1 Tax=Proteobacteria bacterium 228 TaxID=2083153 RepID=A0A2S5KUQ8_9PROT|nr:hypothetical protein [Pokkaliibacter plantistimulans]PPC78594.1 hypothetical protein C4K68_03535 [Pokkaliibacter plantistimulans]